MLFQKLHTIQDDFEKQSQQHILGYSRSIDLILFRINLFVGLNKELADTEASYEFLSQSDEIRYYKHEKPKFQKYGIYYNTLLKLELNVPMGSQKIKNEYYENAFNQIYKTFNDYQEFIIYYRMQSTDRDDNLFVRNSTNNHIFALIEAESMMEEFLSKINDSRNIDEKIKDYPMLTWTGKLSELVLLVKALVLSGSINNGKATIKDVVTYVQIMFNVDLKDYHRKYQDIKSSKNPTKFLDYLIDVVNDDIDQTDEKPFIQKKK